MLVPLSLRDFMVSNLRRTVGCTAERGMLHSGQAHSGEVGLPWLLRLSIKHVNDNRPRFCDARPLATPEVLAIKDEFSIDVPKEDTECQCS